MSQTESPSEHLRQQRRELLLDLAKQAEARKQQVRQMLAQCAGERDKEAERQRGMRMETLKKISTEVREIRDSAVKPTEESNLAAPAPPPLPETPTARVVSLRAPTPMLSIGTLEAEDPIVASQPEERVSAVAPPAMDLVFEGRMSSLEDAFAKLVQTVTEKLDYSTRIQVVEAQVRGLRESIDELSTKLHPLEGKCDLLRTDLRTLELSGDRLGDQVKTFDQMFASLGRDSQKVSNALDALSGEIRELEGRSAEFEKSCTGLLSEKSIEMNSLQERLTRLESGMVRAIGLLQSSEQGIADLSNLRERFLEMESGFQRVLRAVDSLQKPPEVTDNAAEREATANVLASLTKLVQGMRAAQNERQIQQGVKPA